MIPSTNRTEIEPSPLPSNPLDVLDRDCDTKVQAAGTSASRAGLCGLGRSDYGVLGVVLGVSLTILSYRVVGVYGPSPAWIQIEQLSPQSSDLRIDINKADWPLLDLLPGLSERLARRILDHRTVHGMFREPADLGCVPGIGPKLVDRLTPHLTGWQASGATDGSVAARSQTPLAANRAEVSLGGSEWVDRGDGQTTDRIGQ